MEKKELDEILSLHLKWLKDEPDGKRADLRSADLRNADLRSADLRDAYLRSADLRRADLRNADLSGADLRSADLSGADLRRADLRDAYLRSADLSGADLRDAYLSGADLRSADLSGADLRSADLRDAYLRSARNLNEAKNLFVPIACPEEGSFTAFKKAETQEGYAIVQLLIPEDAKRTSATGRKCRADKAKVVKIWNLDRTECNLEEVYSSHDNDFKYRVGEEITPKEPFCEKRWNECSSGIHFFITFQEAVNY